MHQPLRLGVGHAAHQGRVHHGEDRGVQADAERERDDGHRGEAGAVAETAEPVPEVLEQGAHRGGLSGGVGARRGDRAGTEGRVVPPAPGREVGPAARVHRVDDAVLLLVRLAADEDHGLVLSVVEEGVADAGPGGEGGEIAGLHPVELAVDPRVHLAGDDEDELLLARLGVGPGGAGAREDPHQMEPDAAEPGRAADGARGRHVLVAVRVAVPGLGDVGGGDDERGSARHGRVQLALSEPSSGTEVPERPAVGRTGRGMPACGRRRPTTGRG